MNRVSTQVIKAREVVVSFDINETEQDDVMNLDRLRKEGSRDFGGQRVDVKLTDYLTIHNVIAIDDIKFVPAKKVQGYLDGTENPRGAHVTVKLIIDNARTMKLHEEKLIGNDGDVLELPASSVRALR